MSTFNAHLRQIATGPDGSPAADAPLHQNPHARPDPVDLGALFRLLQDQMGTLATDAPTEANRDFLRGLVELLELDVHNPPTQIPGVTQEYL